VLKRGSSVGDLAGKIHKDFLENLKSARVWGTGVFEGQVVGRDHILQEGDIVELKV
jgi:ribosome-interacting GTPase 1